MPWNRFVRFGRSGESTETRSGLRGFSAECLCIVQDGSLTATCCADISMWLEQESIWTPDSSYLSAAFLYAFFT